MSRSSSVLERKLRSRVEAGIEGGLADITPGLHLRAFQKGQLKIDLSMGQVYPFYDLASLTKIIFTVPALMRLFQEGRIDLREELQTYLSWWPHSGQRPIDLLTHTAGLPWWLPFYEKLSGPMNYRKRWEQLKEQLRHVKRESREKAIYSDVDFLALGALVEALYDQPLDEVWEAQRERWGLEELRFHRNNKAFHARRLYAPTETCDKRGKTLQGEVHDENTWYLGGVAPQAGLFGNMEDLSKWGLLLRKAYQSSAGSRLASRQVMHYFSRRAVPASIGDWGLGFMKPTKGSASCGRCFSSSSFGHTGFTGTSVWYDPPKDLLVIILSNRVHPTRDNRRFVELRPQLHDWVCETLPT